MSSRTMTGVFQRREIEVTTGGPDRGSEIRSSELWDALTTDEMALVEIPLG